VSLEDISAAKLAKRKSSPGGRNAGRRAEFVFMLLRNRISGIDSAPVSAGAGYEHVPAAAVAVLRWLGVRGVEYVLVGPIARAIRGDRNARGPVAVAPAPYGRNLDRLARALADAKATPRPLATLDRFEAEGRDLQPLSLSGAQLAGAVRWELRCGGYEIDVEGRPDGLPSYQELLFEAVRFELAPEVSAEVAAPEDIELYDHIRRTGVVPELTVTRFRR
jgi:hypothetical protein